MAQSRAQLPYVTSID